MNHGRKILLAISLGLIVFVGSTVSGYASESAVILQYHRFGESDFPSTNIKIKQFENHINYLKNEGFSVLPVPHIIAALKAGQSLPDKTIGITIDDAVSSVYEIAWPKLMEAGFPFTLFVSTDAIDHKNRRSLSWIQIREMASSGVTIGDHSAAHEHMWQMTINERKLDLDRAQRRFLEELNYTPTLFAYPFGEFDTSLLNEIKGRGYDVAFGQQSGVIYGGLDFMRLPRFSLNEKYGDIDRFKLIVNTLPLKITDLTPQNPVLSENPPNIGFTVSETHANVKELACFASGQGRAGIEILGSQRIEVRLEKSFSEGRNRLNCTLPGPGKRWHWLGLQFIVP